MSASSDLALTDPTAVGDPSPAAPPRSLQRNSLLVMLSSVAVGTGNYAFSLILLWLLPSRQFSTVASASALLLVIGTASTSVLPWVVARPVARSAFGSTERRQAVGFALGAGLALGLAVGLVMAALASPYAPVGICVLLASTSVCLFVAGVGTGYLIGAERFALLAVVSVVEVLIKLGAGAALAASGGGATGAFAGSALGALMWAGVALWIIRREVSWPRTRPPTELWQQLGGVGTSQVLVSVLTTLDVIVGSIVIGTGGGLATYQAMLVFSRVPLFVSTAVSGVAYPKLVGRRVCPPRVVHDASKMYLLLSLPIVACVATLPGPLLGVVLPHRYLHSLGLLVPMTIAGLAAGQLNLSTTFLQANLLFRSAIRVLALAVPSIAVVFILFGTTIGHLAWSGAVAMSVLAVVILLQTSRRFGPARLLTTTVGVIVVLAAAEAGLRRLTPDAPIWIIAAVAVGAMALLAARPAPRRPGPPRVLILPPTRPLSARVDDGLHSLVTALRSDGREVTVGLVTASPDGWPPTVLPAIAGGRTRRASDHRRPGGPGRAVRAAVLLHRSQPDVLVEVVRSTSALAVGPWWHGGAAVAIADGTGRGRHVPAAPTRRARRRRLDSYDHVVSAACPPSVDGAPLPASALGPEGGADGHRLSPLAAALRLACERALADDDLAAGQPGEGD